MGMKWVEDCDPINRVLFLIKKFYWVIFAILRRNLQGLFLVPLSGSLKVLYKQVDTQIHMYISTSVCFTILHVLMQEDQNEEDEKGKKRNIRQTDRQDRDQQTEGQTDWQTWQQNR